MNVFITIVLAALYMAAGLGFYRLVKREPNWNRHPIMVFTWPIFLVVTGFFRDEA